MHLRRRADGPSMHSPWESVAAAGQGRIRFEFPVVRLWSEAVQRFLNGPLGLLSRAPPANVSREALPSVTRTVARRIETEAAPLQARDLDVVTYNLMGLIYHPDLVERLLPGVRTMRDSSTYQLILDEGRQEGRSDGRAVGLQESRAVEAHNLLMLMGTTKFGPLDDATRTILEGIVDIERLGRMGPRLLTATSWADLLTMP
ncbi:MAG: hypothetical protein ACKVVP_18515 [Chloroflexota bacterium]